jgi:hypothetical protein
MVVARHRRTLQGLCAANFVRSASIEASADPAKNCSRIEPAAEAQGYVLTMPHNQMAFDIV